MRRTLRYRSNVSDVYKEDNSARRIYSRRPFPVISSDIGGDSRNREKTLAPIISVKVFQERRTARSRNDRSIRSEEWSETMIFGILLLLLSSLFVILLLICITLVTSVSIIIIFFILSRRRIVRRAKLNCVIRIRLCKRRIAWEYALVDTHTHEKAHDCVLLFFAFSLKRTNFLLNYASRIPLFAPRVSRCGKVPMKVLQRHR